MMLTHDPIKLQLAQLIHGLLKQLYPENTLAQEEIYAALTEAPNLEMGHLAFGCFPLAKMLKKGPPQISQALAQAMAPLLMNHPLLAKAQSAGPYLNFFLKTAPLAKGLLGEILSGAYFSRKLTQGTPKTMIEFSQPNTHKELHVGHMRNLCYGDAIVRLHKYCGYDITTSTFPGDVGTHVAKCLWYLKYHNQEKIPETGKGKWLGSMYSKGHLKLEDELGTPQESENRKQLTEILQQLEKKAGPYYDLWRETRTWSLDLMNEVYAWSQVSFDRWYFESEVDSASVALVKKYQAQGLFHVSEGAVGIDLKEFNLGFSLLIKSDGNGNYACKDLELARRKFEDFKIEKSLYVVDKRQALHFQQVFKILELMGFEQAKNCVHLQYDFVELPDGAMSSRKGNIVPVTDLMQNMEEMIAREYLEKNAELSEAEKKEIARDVARGAIKFGMVAVDPGRKIVFDMKEWMRLDGDSGPYLQYVHARISSLLGKLAYDPNAPWSGENFTHPVETALLLKLMSFNQVVLTSTEQYKPSFLCTYLFELCKLFNQFYVECPIGKAPTAEQKTARLVLAASVGKTLASGLSLLGMPAVKKM